MAASEEDIKVALLESKIMNLIDLISRNEEEIKNIERDIESKYEKIERCIEKGIDRIENKVWNLLYWTISGFVGVLGLLAHIKGWI